MYSEMESLVDNNVFELSKPPEGKSLVGGRWVFANKFDADGNVKHKARYVAKGYSQKENIDYFETFSPTVNMTSVRMLILTAVNENMLVHQINVKTAYLNAPIDCELYVKQPEGYKIVGENGEELVWRLNKSLYGLKQSGRNWNHVLHNFLVGEGFIQSSTDPCVYSRGEGNSRVLIIFWVDDIIIAAGSERTLYDVKKTLSSHFSMKDLGELRWFLGIGCVRSPNQIEMSHKRYFENVLERFGMTNCKPRSIPCTEDINKEVDDTPLLSDPRMYREIVGSLIYAMSATRPDLSYIVTKLSQKMSNPTEKDLYYAKEVLRYLKGTLECTLVFRKEDEVQIQGYCDSDWASSSDRKSVSGYVFQMAENGGFISWRSKKQPVVALYSCEAEYIALAGCVKECLFLRKLAGDIFDPQFRESPVVLGVDNQGAIALAKNPVKQQRSKHIDVRYHFVRSEVTSGAVELYYVPSEYNRADEFTKPVSRRKFQQL